MYKRVYIPENGENNNELNVIEENDNELNILLSKLWNSFNTNFKNIDEIVKSNFIFNISLGLNLNEKEENVILHKIIQLFSVFISNNRINIIKEFIKFNKYNIDNISYANFAYFIIESEIYKIFCIDSEKELRKYIEDLKKEKKLKNRIFFDNKK